MILFCEILRRSVMTSSSLLFFHRVILYIFIFKYLLCVLTQNQFNLIAIDIGHFSTNLISLDKKSISSRFIFLPFSFLQVFCFAVWVTNETLYTMSATKYLLF